MVPTMKPENFIIMMTKRYRIPDRKHLSNNAIALIITPDLTMHQGARNHHFSSRRLIVHLLLAPDLSLDIAGVLFRRAEGHPTKYTVHMRFEIPVSLLFRPEEERLFLK